MCPHLNRKKWYADSPSGYMCTIGKSPSWLLRNGQPLIAKASACCLYGSIRKVLLCSSVYSIIADILCNTADLSVLMHTTLIQLQVKCMHR